MVIHTYQIRLHDTDAAGVIYFASILRIAHEVFERFMGDSGLELGQLLDTVPYLLPIVHAEADFIAPIKLGLRLHVQFSIKKVGVSSFTTRYEFMAPTGQRVATAELVHAAIDRPSGLKTTLPEPLVQALKPHLEV